tara:strand:- start:1890 stop:2411 length:522 start_codon:yes stop_codon:yes gene_type:complete
MSIFTVLSVVGTIGQTLVSIQQANILRASYEAQARQAELEAKIKRVEAKENANLALRRLNETISSNIARAAAGSVNPFTGSPSFLNQVSTLYGMTDFITSQESGILGEATSIAEASMLRDAGRTSQGLGYISALADSATNIFNVRQNLIPTTTQTGSKRRDQFGFDQEDRDMG